jgi:hypothetical protein
MTVAIGRTWIDDFLLHKVSRRNGLSSCLLQQSRTN